MSYACFKGSWEVNFKGVLCKISAAAWDTYYHAGGITLQMENLRKI